MADKKPTERIPTIEERVAELLVGVPPLSDEQVRAASQILKAARRSMHKTNAA
jgi:hypothetical protein